MARSTLARHGFGVSGRYTRTSAEGGGGGTGGTGGGSTGAGSGTDGAGTGGAGAGTGGQNGTGGTGPQLGPNGYPLNTPLEQMTVDHREAYWKHYARTHEATASARSDYDEQKRLADLYRAQQRESLPPNERALEDAREAGRREVAAAAATDTVAAVLRVAFEARNKEGDELTMLVAAANPAAFLTDGKVDAAKVSSYANAIAGSPGGGGAGGGAGAGQQNGGQQSGGGSIGQGQQQSAPSRGVGAGKSLYAERHPQKAAASANA